MRIERKASVAQPAIYEKRIAAFDGVTVEFGRSEYPSSFTETLE